MSPDSRTLDYQEQECSFTVVATEGLVLSYRYVSGDISLNTSRTGVISQGNVITFRVSTNDNTTGRTQTGVFVVQATAGGTTYQSNEVTVYKTGVPGTITITPNTAVFPATSGSTTFEVATTNINTATMGVNVYEDTIGIVSATLNNDRTALTVE